MQILVFAHKFYYHKETLPEIFANYFASNNIIHSYKTRNKNTLHLFSVASSYGRGAVQFKGGTLWNNLPAALQSPMSLRTFKIKIKQYFVDFIIFITWFVFVLCIHVWSISTVLCWRKYSFLCLCLCLSFSVCLFLSISLWKNIIVKVI